MIGQPSRVLLADDHALVRSGLRMILVPAISCATRALLLV